MISFAPFWNMLQKRKISIYDLEYKYDLNPAEISRLKNNHNFTVQSLNRYCRIFHCNIEDIIVYEDEHSHLCGIKKKDKTTTT